MRRIFPLIPILVVLLAVLGAQASPKPPAVPAKINVSVSPGDVSPGGESTVTVLLEPIRGVKINKYPKIKLKIPAKDGVVGDSEASLGNSSAPKLGASSKANYFDPVEPLELTLKVDEAAPTGAHEIEAKLTYFYCMPANGFCAPKRTTVNIPISVR